MAIYYYYMDREKNWAINRVFQIALRGGGRWEILLGGFFYWAVGT